MSLFVVLGILCSASVTLSEHVISPCKITDTPCIERSINAVMPTIFNGDSKLGVPSSDPLFIDKIENEISILKFNFYNCTVYGFKSCSVSNLKLDEVSEGKRRLRYDLTCLKMSTVGKYDISGRLILIPVEGSGDCKISLGKYIINVDSEVNRVKEEDGKSHLAVKNFKLKCYPQEPIKFEFENLFNGQKELSDAVHKFAHENWRQVADLVQDPMWYACVKRMISNVNKYLKHIAVEDILIN